MSDSAFFCVLDHEGVLAVRGSDASKFLQGQLTCNLNYLGPNASSLGARCTPKGRMQSSFRIVQHEDGYLLAMAAELLDAQLADLKKYAVFSKATLTHDTSHWVRFGIEQGDAVLAGLGVELPAEPNAVVRHDGALFVRVSPHRAEAWLATEQAEAFQARLSSTLPQASVQAWLLGQVRAGLGQVFGPTRELFIPQMINLQAVGGVSFKKGCYTGQEIVARMQYLGKLKRRLYRLAQTAGEPPAPGTPLFAPVHATAVGEVVMAAPAGTGFELLAVLQGDAVERGDVSLGANDGPRLTLLDLPYTLDRDLEIQR
jgi:folate-binding protein YgfZ